MAGGIFISYRREDSQHAAGRLVDRLAQTFPRDQLFMDVDAIEPGLDFLEVINAKLADSDVMLAVIGPSWIDCRDEGGARRLDDPADFVRLEIETALKRRIRVIPVLVDGAQVPKADSLPETLRPLVRRNAVTIAHAKFGADTEALVRTLTPLVRAPAHRQVVGEPAPSLGSLGTFRPGKQRAERLRIIRRISVAAGLLVAATAFAIIVPSAARGPFQEIGGITARTWLWLSVFVGVVSFTMVVIDLVRLVRLERAGPLSGPK
jgi:TIR domain